jgi:hypothetical protein
MPSSFPKIVDVDFLDGKFSYCIENSTDGAVEEVGNAFPLPTADMGNGWGAVRG